MSKKQFKPIDGLPDPNGSLSAYLLPDAINLANVAVHEAMTKTRKSKKPGSSYAELVLSLFIAFL